MQLPKSTDEAHAVAIVCDRPGAHMNAIRDRFGTEYEGLLLRLQYSMHFRRHFHDARRLAWLALLPLSALWHDEVLVQ
jgi:hypothetical protein